MSEPSRLSVSGRPQTADQRYWQLWRSGKRPELATFLAGLADAAPADVASVVAIDQYERWMAGDRVPAESYLKLLPDGEGREQAACDVVYGEYLLRERLGEPPSPAEYRHRFPELAGALALMRQIEVHHALAETPGGPPSTDGGCPPPAADPFPVIPGFELIEEIGRGGMGVVYKARQVSLDRDVALKVLRVRTGRDSVALERIRREAHLTGRLSHPHIVTVFDAGSTGEWFYIAMEYVAGIDLHRLVEESGPLPAARTWDYLRQAALGLQYAYEHGLVHRDVKPSNLIVTRSDGAGRAVLKVLDLGLARSRGVVGLGGAPITQVGDFMGTPDFVAPEQANDPRAADVRSDLYSLGCTFYYVLTGRAPFGGATPLAKLMQHHLDDAPLIGADLSAGLSAVIRKLMAKNPADRYQTPAELVAAIDAARAQPAGRPAERPAASLLHRLSGPEDWVKCVAFSPDGKLVAGGSVDRTVRLWDAQTGLEVWRGDAHSSAVLCLAFAPDGRLVTGGQDRALCLWDVNGRSARLVWHATGHADNVNAVCFLPEGRILSASHDATLRLWDAAGNEAAVWRAHTGPVWDVAVSGDGRLAISGGQDRAVRVWDVARGVESARWDYDCVISCVALSADGRLAVIGGADGEARLWDVAARRQVAVLRGHESRITAAAFSPDGRFVLTGGRDRTARLFDAAGAALLSLAEHTWWVTAVAWSPAAPVLATGSGDRTVGLWRLSGV